MHGFPDGEVALKLNVVVRSSERLWPCCGVDDPAVDDLDEALTTTCSAGVREAPPHRAPVTLCLKHRLTQRLIRPSGAVDCGGSLLPTWGRRPSCPFRADD